MVTKVKKKTETAAHYFPIFPKQAESRCAPRFSEAAGFVRHNRKSRQHVCGMSAVPELCAASGGGDTKL
ncbi:MAG: hypothetical protein EGP74_06125 [Alistipes finegoldii]|jgi:hypothetical protein|nr:hypothetical protein [Alistipes finegoldii]MBD9128907.1 hypothetical protein [Alistipes finegoldii]OKY95119.1 MAG: hypothetical protein BHV65_10930 [Alistipes sp. 58_9_plus]